VIIVGAGQNHPWFNVINFSLGACAGACFSHCFRVPQLVPPLFRTSSKHCSMVACERLFLQAVWQRR
jgi:hypothetical protein